MLYSEQAEFATIKNERKKSFFDSFECQEILTCQLMSFWGWKHFKFADFLNQIVESDGP
jgi:hypothetical protein